MLTILEVYLVCELVEIAFELGCSSLRCVDIGVGFVCQLLALLIVSEMCQFKQLAWDMGAIYIHCSVHLCSED